MSTRSYPNDRWATNRHAVYAVAEDWFGKQETFRIGLPTDWDRAIARWYRLDNRKRAGRAIRIRWNRRTYTVKHFEVRSVDQHGRGLSSAADDRHARAFPVPYIAARAA